MYIQFNSVEVFLSIGTAQNNSNTFKTKRKEMPGCREKKSSELTLTHLLQCTNTGKINTYRIATVLTATLKNRHNFQEGCLQKYNLFCSP